MIKTIYLKNVNVISNLKERVYKQRKQAYYNNILKAIKDSEKDIENGRVIPAEKVFEELRKKYEY